MWRNLQLLIWWAALNIAKGNISGSEPLTGYATAYSLGSYEPSLGNTWHDLIYHLQTWGIPMWWPSLPWKEVSYFFSPPWSYIWHLEDCREEAQSVWLSQHGACMHMRLSEVWVFSMEVFFFFKSRLELDELRWPLGWPFSCPPREYEKMHIVFIF